MLNAKKKGNAGENQFAEFLREHGFKAFRDGASGASVHKSDIVNGLDYSIEVKTVKKINLKKAWRQVSRDSSIAHNSPLLAIRFDGMPEKSWIVCLDSSDWVETEKECRKTLKSAPQTINIGQSIDSISRESKYAVANLIASAKKVLKIYTNEN